MNYFTRTTSWLILSALIVTLLGSVFVPGVLAQASHTINYQGKLTDSTGLAVADGTYNMRFWLLTTPSIATTSAVWTESLTSGNRVQVTNGLFSVMLGSTTALTGVDFNQTLYLGVEIGGTGVSPAWDGEMSPRKILGTVPSAFEARQLGGVASSSFLRSDVDDSASGLLTFTGGLISNSSTTIRDLTTLTATTTNFVINGERFTDLTGTGLSNTSGVLTVATTTLGLSAAFTNSAQLAALLSDETGTGVAVFGTSPTISGATLSGNVTLSGLTGARALFTDASSIATTTALSAALLNSLTDETGTGALVFGTSPTFTTSGNFGNAGVRLSDDGDGALTFLGLGNGFDEDLTLNLDDTTNTGVFTSSTGLNRLTFTDMGINVSSSTLGYQFDGTTFITASTTNDSISFGELAGDTFNSLTINNLAIGFEAGRFASTTASDGNNFIGSEAGRSNTGGFNVILGSQQNSGGAGEFNTGSNNNIIGTDVGVFNTGSFNNIMGSRSITTGAGAQNTGSSNNIFGPEAGAQNTGSLNNIFGWGAGQLNEGDNNNFFGNQTGRVNRGDFNEFFGFHAGLWLNATSTIAIGAESLRGAGSVRFSAVNNVAIGYRTGYSATNTADNNILIGYQAADNLTTGNNNIIIGYDIDNITATTDNSLNIGNLIFGTGLDGTGTTLASGNVGIGTSTPTQRLTVDGGLRVTGALVDNASSTGSNGMVLQSTGTGFNWVATSTLGLGGASFTNSAQLAALLSDETGTGVAVFGTSPTISGATLSGNVTLSGLIGARALFTDASSIATTTALSAALLNSLTDETGTGSVVFSDSPTLTGSVAYNPLHTGTLTITSSLAGGARSTNPLVITQASDGTNNNTAGLLQLTNADTGSVAALFNVNQVTTGAGITVTGVTTGTSVSVSNTGGFGYAANSVTSGTALSAASVTTGILVAGGTTLTTGTGLSAISTALTSGSVVAGSMPNTITTGSVVSVTNAAAGITADYTGALINLSPTRTLTAAATRNESGNYLRINRANITNGVSSIYNITGALASLTSNCTQTLGTCTDSSNILSLTQSYATATGAVLNIAGAGTGNLATLDATNINANGVLIDVQSNSGAQFAFRVTGNNGVNNIISAQASGNVGIGTSTPTQRLTVDGGLRVTGALVDNASSTGSNGMVLQSTGTGFNWVATSTLGLGGASFTNSAQLAALLSDETGTGVAVFGTSPTISGATLSGNVTLSGLIGARALFTDASSIATTTALSAALLNSLTDETGTGVLVFSNSPTFTGTINAASTTLSAQLTLSGTTANVALGSNFLSGDGDDEGLTVDSGGNVGIGTTSPNARFAIQRTGFSTNNGVATLDQWIQTTNNTLDAILYGNRFNLINANTATSTLVGALYRIEDSTAYGNTVRGLEVQTNRGVNTNGENTAISGTGRTFGIRGITEGDAGGTFEPAGGFFQTRGSTQGNAIRGYSASITSAALLSLFQDTSAFTGTGLEMNFGNTTGSFSSTSSRFIDLQNAGTSVFTVSALGTTTIGDGTNFASVLIGRGGLCVDNDGSCIATTSGRISSVSSYTGNSDLAEMYFSSQTLEAGEIVMLNGGLSVNRAQQNSTTPVLGVVSTKPGLLLGFDDTSLKAGETGFPIALSGRVPVKLSTENGPIKKGDQLMLSSIPGVAMKATSTGAIVGIALEDFDETRMYSNTYVNQFSDDIPDPDFTPVTSNTDPRINDGCYYGGGTDSEDIPCIPLQSTDSESQVREAKRIAEQESRARVVRTLERTSSQTRTLANGQTVKVGQVVMFVNLQHRWFDDTQMAILTSLMSTETENIGENSSETLFDRVTILAQNFVDGVLSIFELRANKVQVTEQLCVEDVCVTADDLRALLNTGAAVDEVSSNPPANESPKPDVVPEPEVTPPSPPVPVTEETPTPEPESEPESEPEPKPDVVPEPEVTPPSPPVPVTEETPEPEPVVPQS